MEAHRALFIVEMMAWLSYSGKPVRRANLVGIRMLNNKRWCSTVNLRIESDVVRAAGTYR